MKSGVYIVERVPTRRVYIGSSVNMLARWTQHRKELRAGKHANRFLQAACNKYGESAFKFWVGEECPESQLTREQWWLDMFQPFRAKGFNLSRDANGIGFLGRQKQREAALGRTFSQETRAKMRAAKLGKTHTVEHNAKISVGLKGSKSRTGQTLSPETREKIRQGNLGKIVPTEVGAKISAAKRGICTPAMLAANQARRKAIR